MSRIREQIKDHIRMWDGTVHGQMIKNMLDNGADLESICEAAGIDYDESEDEEDV